MIRNPTPITVVLAAALTFCAGAPAEAQAPPPADEQVLLTRAEALREIFPGAAHIESAAVAIDAPLRARVEARLGRRLAEEEFPVFRALGAAGEATGYAVITEEIGKYHPITFIVGVTPQARVSAVAVLVYRESHGGDVKRQRFLRQFAGKGIDDPIRVSRDIINVSGATLSAHAISRGTKKVLVLLDECLLGARAAAAPKWQACAAEAPASPAAPGGAPTGDAGGAAGPLRRNRFAMGTLLEAKCWGDPETAGLALDAAFAEVARLEGLLSTFIAESELSRVNARAAREAVPVSSDTLDCIAAALAAAEKSGGAFDPTLKREGWRAVEIDRAANTVRFRRDDIALDLGGIGKGFALDRAARVLEEHGVHCAILDFGGQVLALDPPAGEDAWLVGVRDPRDAERFLGYFRVVRASVSTSARYERGDHIIDPRTGEPARRSSATICHPSAACADAYSTALFVLGRAGLERLAPVLPDGAAVLVTGDDGGGGGDNGDSGDLLVAGGPRAPRFVAAREPQ